MRSRATRGRGCYRPSGHRTSRLRSGGEAPRLTPGARPWGNWLHKLLTEHSAAESHLIAFTRAGERQLSRAESDVAKLTILFNHPMQMGHRAPLGKGPSSRGLIDEAESDRESEASGLRA